MHTLKRLVLLLSWFAAVQFSSCITNTQDAAALRALMDEMKNTPPNWGLYGDPCDAKWDGITCSSNSRVVQLKLYSMGIDGTLSSNVGSLTELQSLDLSYNKNLGGPLPAAIGNLKQLTTLILIGCSFSGSIPNELGNLINLTFLALNSNRFTGEIPASLGRLSRITWLDLAQNQLSGSLPVSTESTPGLDQLVNAKHFHLNHNKFSGQIPDKLFNSNLTLLHVLLDRNQLTGRIPGSIGLVKTLRIIRLDHNYLNGSVPSTINDLTSLNVINLANNMLSGPMPNLTGMYSLNSVDLSNNSFVPSETPSWFTEFQNLTSLVIESGGLYGNVPQTLFSFPRLQQVVLKNNQFNGSLDMGINISQNLRIVNFQNNNLTSVDLSSAYNNTIMLIGNPVCSNILLAQTSSCHLQQESPPPPYLTNRANCSFDECPQKYNCSHPYEGNMVFRAPFFQEVTNQKVFDILKESVWEKYGSTVGSISLQNPFFDDSLYLQVKLKLCPSTDVYFNRSEILIQLDLSSQNYAAPLIFGPYYLDASSYQFPGDSAINKGLIIGVVVGCTVLFLGFLVVGLYAFRQKKRAQKAIEISNPFASWISNEDAGDAPKLKGARCFSIDELKKYTNNFPRINEIGSGGYGKVYRGMLPDGQIVAIKRSQVGSNQGGLEFKTEIELLSRVHHKNLVGLVGFCFQQGERILVYEYISNGTLRDCLSGTSGVCLDWKTRLWIALGSGRGLAYLHEHAHPPIIHRDIKSTNILLDENLNAKVADFGLSTLVPEKGYVSTQVKGTLGYLDPEYYMTQQLTEKSDVYSFGVVMFELISSRPPIHKGKYIVREIKMSIDHNDEVYYGLKDLIDPIICDANNLVGFRRFIELALQCVQDSSEDRPTMSYIVKAIETILEYGGTTTSFVSLSPFSAMLGTENYSTKQHYYDSDQGRDISNTSSDTSLFSQKTTKNGR